MNSNATSRRLRHCLSAASAFALIAGLCAAPSMAAAQTAAASAEQTLAFNDPAGPLDAALRRFADRTGFQMVYDTSIVQGLKTAGVSGRMTPREALAHLLAGTALTFHMPEPHTVIIEALPASVGGARTLGAVQVEGVQADAFAALDGFGAGAGANGSSDPTATEGTGSLTTNGASVASKTPLALKDTPQSVTVITAERIQEQNLTDLTSALNYTPGVTLVNSTNQFETTFYSRGFQVTTLQIDGGGPLDLGANSFYETTPNLAEYDNIQVLRGSDALFGGAGQPGAVVSLDRKRPLDHEQFLGEVDVGSWNNYQAQIDATGPIGFEGHLRARVVLTEQDTDFFYELAHQTKSFAYGVLEADLGPDTIVRVGSSFEQQNNTGWNANGLPRYSDGGDLQLPRSTSLSAPWNLDDFRTPELFAALEHRFNSDWGLKFNFVRLAQNSTSTYDVNSGLVYRDNPAQSTYEEDQISTFKPTSVQNTADVTINGTFQLFGLKQTITMGTDYSLSDSSQLIYRSNVSVPINVFSFNPASLNPEPAGPSLYQTEPVWRQEQWGAYFTLNLQPIRDLHLVGGVRVSSYWDDEVVDYYLGSPTIRRTSRAKNDTTGVLTPYAAATYGLTSEISLYASYADIFQSQAELLDPSGKPLPPITGATYETGIKGAFKGGKLNTSLSIYYTDQSNQGIMQFGNCVVGFICWQNNGAVISQGVDLELSGEILPGWQFQGGYTYNVNRYNQAFLNSGMGNGLNSVFLTQQPKNQAKIWTSYTPSGWLSRWTVGGGLRLESARYTTGSVCSVELNPTTGACPSKVSVPFSFTQGLYAVADLRAAYKLSSHWQASLDITNIGDTRYYATAGYSTYGNFYGQPRSVMFSLRARY